MGEFFQLLIDPLHHQRMPVARVDHRNAAAEIHIAVALNIPDFGILGPRRHDGSTHANAPRNRLGAPLHPLLVHAGC